MIPVGVDQVVSQNEEIAIHFNNYSNVITMGLTNKNGVSEINCLTAHCWMLFEKMKIIQA